MSIYSKSVTTAVALVFALLFVNLSHAEQSSNSPDDSDAQHGISNPDTTELNNRLWEAVQGKDLEQVQQLLHGGADINAKFEKERTVLFEAIRKPDGRIIETLIKAGADIQVRDSDGNTPLLYAVKRENLIPVQILLSYGANPNEQDNSGNDTFKIAKRDQLRSILEVLSEIQESRSALGLFVDMRGRELTLERFRVAAVKAFEIRNWQNIDANDNHVSGIYEGGGRIFKSTMIYEPDLLVIKFEPAMGYRKPFYLEALRSVFLSELENQ